MAKKHHLPTEQSSYIRASTPHSIHTQVLRLLPHQQGNGKASLWRLVLSCRWTAKRQLSIWHQSSRQKWNIATIHFGMVVSCINKLQVLPTGFVACPARTVSCLLAVAAMAKQPLSMPCKTSSIIWASRIKRQVRTSASASIMPKTLSTSAKRIPKIGGHSWTRRSWQYWYGSSRNHRIRQCAQSHHRPHLLPLWTPTADYHHLQPHPSTNLRGVRQAYRWPIERDNRDCPFLEWLIQRLRNNNCS